MYKKRELWIPREEAQELEEDEYYIADLIGMDVVLEDGSKFGTLKDGCTDVLVVNDGSTDSTAGIIAGAGVGSISYAPNRGKGYALSLIHI